MTGVRRDAALRVLAYHGIADHGGDPVLGSFSVPPEVFARQLDTLLRAGCHFIDGERFLRYLVGDCGLPRRPVLLTFDDCYRDLLEVALPLLEARDIPAVAFAVAGHVGGTNVWDRARGAPRQELLDAEGLRTLAARGVEIGAHGWSHRPLPEVPADELAREVSGALDALEALGIPRPRMFAYPYGACNFPVFQAAVGAGLRAAFSVRPAPVDPAEGHFLVPRIVIFREDQGWRFRWKVESVLYDAALSRLRKRTSGRIRRAASRLRR